MTLLLILDQFRPALVLTTFRASLRRNSRRAFFSVTHSGMSGMTYAKPIFRNKIMCWKPNIEIHLTNITKDLGHLIFKSISCMQSHYMTFSVYNLITWHFLSAISLHDISCLQSHYMTFPVCNLITRHFLPVYPITWHFLSAIILVTNNCINYISLHDLFCLKSHYKTFPVCNLITRHFLSAIALRAISCLQSHYVTFPVCILITQHFLSVIYLHI